MPFYFKKSLCFGPVRFNLSKSGIGVSAGIKGFRVGSSPRGNYVHMGRGGLYYRASLSKPANTPRMPNSPESTAPHLPPSGTDVIMLDVDSGETGRIVDASSRALVEELQAKRCLARYAPAAIVLGLVACLYAAFKEQGPVIVAALILATIAAFILVGLWDKNRKTTVIFYNLVDDAESVYRNVFEAFEFLSTARRIWHIPSRGAVRDRKYHAGANKIVHREPIQVRFENPPFVRTNIPTPSLAVGAQTLYFFPDKVLVFEKNHVGGLSYDSLSSAITATGFIETDGVPSDAKIIGHTWRYVNKGGGPDKRFKDNRQIPIAQYEEVHFTSSSGLNELLQVSRIGSFEREMSAVRVISSYASTP